MNVPVTIAELANDLVEIKLDRQAYVYFLISEGVVGYVGQSINIMNRIAGHAGGSPWFDRVLALPVKREKLNEIERYWIIKLKPRYNLAFTDRAGPTAEAKAERKRKREIAASRLREIQHASGCVAELEISKQYKTCLVRFGIETVEQIKSLDEMEILSMSGMGETGLIQIRNALAKCKEAANG